MDLVNDIKSGNEFAFEQAYVQGREKVYFYFLKKTRSEADANDLLQVAFLKLWQYRQSLSEDYSLDQHLFHIARTVYIDHLRKENKQQQVKTAADAKTITSNHLYTAAPAEFEMQHHLQKILFSMPDVRRKVFVLHRLQGYSHKEVADHLCISVKAVDNHISKAVKQLKKAFVLVVVVFFLLSFH